MIQAGWTRCRVGSESDRNVLSHPCVPTSSPRSGAAEQETVTVTAGERALRPSSRLLDVAGHVHPAGLPHPPPGAHGVFAGNAIQVREQSRRTFQRFEEPPADSFNHPRHANPAGRVAAVAPPAAYTITPRGDRLHGSVRRGRSWAPKGALRKGSASGPGWLSGQPSAPGSGHPPSGSARWPRSRAAPGLAEGRSPCFRRIA